MGKRSYRKLGELTRQHPETVRRYMQGQHPSVEFVTSLCHELDLNANWLLTGRGPMRASEVRGAALDAADPRELLSAVATALEELTHRVDRIEVFVQSMETRVRVQANGEKGPNGTERYVEGKAGDGESARRAGLVADAVGERARPDTD